MFKLKQTKSKKMKTKTTKIVKGKYIHNNTQYYLLKEGSDWLAVNECTGEPYFTANSLKQLIKMCDNEYQLLSCDLN